MKISGLILLFLLISSCSTSQKRTPYDLDFPENLIILGHKGSGTFSEYGNTFSDNSVAGILNAIEQLDGAEVDLQMSADSTLWLFHDHTILNCNGEVENIALLTDSMVEEYSKCSYGAEVACLEDLIIALIEKNTSSKTLSLDLKVLQNPVSLEHFGGENELAKLVAEQIKHHFSELSTVQLFVEVPSESQVRIFEEITGKTTFLIHNSFEYLRKESRFNHSAPIHHFNDEVPQLFQSYGQQSLVWVVNSADEMMAALQLRPTAIQTDNIPMVQFFKQLPQRGDVLASHTYPASDTVSDFFLLTEVNEQINQDKLYEVDFGKNKLEGIQLVFSSADNLGANTKWKSLPLYKSKHYFFLGEKEHELLGTKAFKIYLWHSDGSEIRLTDEVKIRKVVLSQN